MIFTLSCSKDTNEEVKNETAFKIPELLNTKKLENLALLDKANNSFSKSLNTRSSLNRMDDLPEFDYNNTTISEYSDTEVKAIIVNQVDYDIANDVNYSILTYTDDVNVLPESLLIKFEKISETETKTSFLNFATNELLGEFTSVNGIVTKTDGKPRKSWFSFFGGCVSDFFNWTTSGSGTGAVIGLGCVASGPYCAGAIAIYCAGESLSDYALQGVH